MRFFTKLFYSPRLFTVLFVCVTFLVSIAKTNGANRAYDPVVMSGEQFPNFVNVPVNNLVAYSFREGVWEQIPFQIDERDGNNYFGAKDGLLNLTDEFCFMVADMGDSAADFQWIDDAESLTHARYEIKVTDTSVSPSQTTFIYIYWSSTITADPGLEEYMSYLAPTAVGNDTIHGKSYAFGHNANSVPEYLLIKSQVGGNEIDILDRWKVHYSGVWQGFAPYSQNENDLVLAEPMELKTGPVRIIRSSRFNSTFGSTNLELGPFVTTFYPYSTDFQTGNGTVSSQLGLREVRQSIDYNSQVNGANFYSNKNRGLSPETMISIDGSDDTATIDTEMEAGANWYMMQGSQGTVVSLVDTLKIGEQRELYYNDMASNPNDTGDDGSSWGESGIQISSTETPFSGLFGFATFTYYLGPEHGIALADSLADNLVNPLSILATARDFVVPVELASFTAHQEKDGIYLQWSTESETNNYGFSIERREGSQEIWIQIGFVKGHGTISEKQNYIFADENAGNGDFSYRLKQIDTDGSFSYSPSVEISTTLPVSFNLEQNYPNPFNPETEITFHVPLDYTGKVKINVYNLMGQNIKTLYNGSIQAGLHTIKWDGRDKNGFNTTSGTYIYSLEAGDYKVYKKMLKLL